MTLHIPSIALYSLCGLPWAWLGYNAALLVRMPEAQAYLNDLFAITCGSAFFVFTCSAVGVANWRNAIPAYLIMIALYSTFRFAL